MENFDFKRNIPGKGKRSPGELHESSQTPCELAKEKARPYHVKAGMALCCTIACFLVVLSGCSKQQAELKAKNQIVETDGVTLITDEEFKDAYKNEIPTRDQKSGISERYSNDGFSLITVLELLEARLATAKYRDFDKAIKDGYEDINVIVPNMGYHFMKSAIVDATFQPAKPEILVYNKKANGSYELVAVEYAVPISATPHVAPEGFTGSADVWERNVDFGLWLQHAWIWRFNPDGIFHDTNPNVRVR